MAITVEQGKNLEFRLRGYDLDGNTLSYRIVSLPQFGQLLQLAHNYDFYGYEPKEGAAIRAANTDVTGSKARVVYSPPANGRGVFPLGAVRRPTASYCLLLPPTASYCGCLVGCLVGCRRP